MGAAFAEVKRLARRANYKENQRTMFFSSRVSIYVTYLLSKTRATANGVTYAFTVIGLAATALVYLPSSWAPLAGFAVYRFHVVLDVVDGELARYRRTCSPVGAYLDYLTHYVVYTTTAFGFGVHHYLVAGDQRSILLGFAIAAGLMMNLASKDCWYRANYRGQTEVEGQHKLWKGSAITLVGVRLASVNSIWFLFALASLVRTHPIFVLFDPMTAVLIVYALALPLFALLRIVATARSGRIPRRASWYR